MPTIHIDGVGPVTVSDDFLQLPPDQQDATVQEIAASTRQPVSQSKALGLGILQGATANFADELVGSGVAASKRAKRGGSPLGRSNFEERERETSTAEVRRTFNEAEEAHPWTFLGGQIAGTAASVPTRVMQAATMPERIVRGAAVGAGYGTLAGAGAGESPGDRAIRAAAGGGVGMLAGGAAVPIAAGVEKVGGAIAGRVADRFRAVAKPEAEASRRIVGDIASDIRGGSAGLAPDEFITQAQSGAPVAVMDMGGTALRARGQATGNISAEARGTLEGFVSERVKGQFPRVTDWINRNYNAPNADAIQQSIDAAQRATNAPAYRALFSRPEAQGLWDEGFEQIASAPVVQNAIRQATITARNEGAMQGFRPPLANPFRVDPQTGMLSLKALPDGGVMKPNLQFWDQVKRNLDKMGTGEAQSFARVLRQHLDELVGGYKDVRMGAKSFFDAEHALEAGQNFVRLDKNLAAARREFLTLPVEEKELFRQGFLSRFVEDLGKISDRRDVLNKINDNPNARAKLEMVLGPQKWTEMEAMLRVEGAMQLAQKMVSGFSTTARQQYELILGMGVGGAYGTYTADPNAILYGVLTYGAARGNRAINDRIAARVAQMLTSSDPAVLNRGVAILSRNRQMMDSFRKADEAIARISAGQSQGLAPQLQGPVAGRAEGEQQ